jgi:hypothetical protein
MSTLHDNEPRDVHREARRNAADVEHLLTELQASAIRFTLLPSWKSHCPPLPFSLVGLAGVIFSMVFKKKNPGQCKPAGVSSACFFSLD